MISGPTDFAAFGRSPAGPADAAARIGRIVDPAPLIRTGRAWTPWTGPLISLLVLAMALYQLRTLDLARLRSLLPGGILFWAAFGAYYLASPISEWIIYRRLWSLPLGGFTASLRKLVSNEVLLGYIGEVHFSAWARRHARITAAPFGAIKDVAILSAVVGNLVTLAMLAAAARPILAMRLGIDHKAFALSGLFVLVTSLPALVLRKRLFTLPRRELWIVAGVHLGRIVAALLLGAVMWHLLLPAVALTWLLMLATFRQLLSRLPFLPNKDIVFAGLAAFLVGDDARVVAAMALMATLILAAHLLVGAMLGITEIARESHGR